MGGGRGNLIVTCRSVIKENGFLEVVSQSIEIPSPFLCRQYSHLQLTGLIFVFNTCRLPPLLRLVRLF